MSDEAARLLVAFDTLPPAEKETFVRELIRRLPPVDSGPLEDAVLAGAGDDLAAMLEGEENDALTRKGASPCMVRFLSQGVGQKSDH
jgi:hypothetical protein